MTDSERELEELRKEKLEALKQTAEGSVSKQGESEPSATESPTEPVYLEDTGGLQTFADEHDLVLVDFFADWCGPCKQLEPVVKKIAADTDAAVLKVDIDANPALAAAYNVRSVPTLGLFSNGELVEQLIGYQGEPQLRAVIERHR